MSLELKSFLRHRRLFFCALVISCVTTVFMVSLTLWKLSGQSRENDGLNRRPNYRPLGSDHATGGRHRETRSENKLETRSRSVRILCWIMTDPYDLDVRVIHVKNTWARRCDVTLFFSSKTNKTFPTIGLDVPPGKDNIAVKSRESWTYVFRHHYNNADYFIKADPDTYVLVENLRQYLSHCDPAEPEVFGHRLNYHNTTYFAGAAIILSREALNRLVTIGYAKFKHYINKGKAEDLKNGRCLHEVGVRFVDTRDLNLRETFLPLILSHHLFPSDVYIPGWYQEYRDSDVKTGKQCCSDRPVAFHYVQPVDMYTFDYLIRIADGLCSDTDAADDDEEHHYRRQSFQKLDQPHLQSNRVFVFYGTKNKN